MELLLITAVEAFKKDIKQILKEVGVVRYSYTGVTGYSAFHPEMSSESNWFASNAGENKSLLFYVFVESSNVEVLFESFKKLNDNEVSQSQVHVALLAITKFI